jgi:hypothetical protein
MLCLLCCCVQREAAKAQKMKQIAAKQVGGALLF